MGRRLRALVACCALVLACAGCRVDVEVGLDARADGSGTVRVQVLADRDVASQLDLSEGLRADDLRQAGWTVEGPEPQPDGGLRILVTKPFDDPEGAARAVEELGGADGPFRSFAIERRTSFLRTTTRFRGTVDLAEGVEAFGDPGVRAALGGSDVGVDLAELEAGAGAPLADAVRVAVVVRLPGEATSNAGPGSGDVATWKVRLRERADLEASSTAINAGNLAGAGLVVAAAAGLAVLGVVALGRRRRRYQAPTK